MGWLNAVIQGLLLGGLYALFATGLALVFGTMRLVNLAHGDFTVLPAYFALVIVNATQLNPFYTIPITMVIMFVLGYLIQRGVLNSVVSRNVHAGIIVTFGTMLILQNAYLLIFTANTQSLDAGKIAKLSIKISENLAIGWLPLIIFLTSIVVIAAFQVFLSRTQTGFAIRAVSDDGETAQLMGINHRHIWGIAMAVSLAIIAIGGIMMGIRTSFDPSVGAPRLIYAFEAVIIGGMGSGLGTFLGGLILGVAQTLGAQAFGAIWSILAGHVVFVLVLAFRPQGLIAKTVIK